MEEMKKPRKPRSDKGIPKGPRIPRPHTPIGYNAPIHVRVVLKGRPKPIEFGCSNRTVENGFHVFIYPSERDRYRTTRREFAVSEIIEIEITEAPRVYNAASTAQLDVRDSRPEIIDFVPASTGPKVYSAREAMIRGRKPSIIEQLETSVGPIKMDRPPAVSFGDEAPPGLLTGKAD
jgi:hypothetical protein